MDVYEGILVKNWLGLSDPSQPVEIEVRGREREPWIYVNGKKFQKASGMMHYFKWSIQ